MRCIAIDDSANALELIKIHIRNTPFLSLADTFQSAPAALELINTGNLDLIFIDIEMPEISGMQFVRSLNNTPLIVFTTAYPNYAIEGFEVNAVDYLLKPISFEKFLGAANKAQELFKLKTSQVIEANTSPSSKHLIFKSGTDLHRINHHDIVVIQSQGNYMQVELTNGKSIMSLMTMNETLAKLEGLNFLRCHRGFIVNLDHVSRISNHEVQLGNKVVPLSKTYKDELIGLLGNGANSGNPDIIL